MDSKNETEARAKVWEMIKDIKVAQLVTHDLNEQLHARPMVASSKGVEANTWDGKLWFFTRADSPKIQEIEHNNEVLLSYSEPSDQNYVSLAGTAHVVRDQAKVEELWSEHLRTWFPKGKEDPNIALIHVHTYSAEYWDSPSSAFVYAYGYVKARLTGEMPNPGENKKVAF